MDSKQLERLREQLLELRRSVAGEVTALRQEGFALGTDGTQDAGDAAANTYARQVLLGMSERDRQLLRQVDEALDRMEAGEYGVCDQCGEAIGPARLEVVPYTDLCVECKANQESQPR